MRREFSAAATRRRKEPSREARSASRKSSDVHGCLESTTLKLICRSHAPFAQPHSMGSTLLARIKAESIASSTEMITLRRAAEDAHLRSLHIADCLYAVGSYKSRVAHLARVRKELAREYSERLFIINSRVEKKTQTLQSRRKSIEAGALSLRQHDGERSRGMERVESMVRGLFQTRHKLLRLQGQNDLLNEEVGALRDRRRVERGEELRRTLESVREKLAAVSESIAVEGKKAHAAQLAMLELRRQPVSYVILVVPEVHSFDNVPRYVQNRYSLRPSPELLSLAGAYACNRRLTFDFFSACTSLDSLVQKTFPFLRSVLEKTFPVSLFCAAFSPAPTLCTQLIPVLLPSFCTEISAFFARKNARCLFKVGGIVTEDAKEINLIAGNCTLIVEPVSDSLLAIDEELSPVKIYFSSFCAQTADKALKKLDLEWDAVFSFYTDFEEMHKENLSSENVTFLLTLLKAFENFNSKKVLKF